jgi:hypothetical protein
MMIGTLRVRASPRRRRQHPVEQDEIRQLGLDHLHRLLGAVGARRALAGLRQVDRDQFLDGAFVFDDEDVGLHGDG